MSKHSKWAKVKHAKGAADVKKGLTFTKHSRTVTVAARSGGGDPARNFKLRLAIEEAKADGVPKDTLERAIRRGTGEDKEGAQIEELLYEGFGPGGVAILIEAATDNKNRTSSNLRQLLEKAGGSLAGSGAVSWQFEKMGVIRLDAKKSDELELQLIDLGAQDLKEEEGGLTVYTKAADWAKVNEGVAKLGLKIEYSGLDWVAKQTLAVSDPVAEQKLSDLYEALEADEDVQNYFTNEL